MDTNFIVAGKHEGCAIKTDNDNKVFIDCEMRNSFCSQFLRLYFDKTNVVSIEKVNEEASSFKTSASFWLGSVAAAGMSDVKDIILKITWRDNTESMIKVRESIYTKILATQMSDVSNAFHIHIVTEEERKKNEEEDKKWEIEHFEEIKCMEELEECLKEFEELEELTKKSANNSRSSTMSKEEKKNVRSGCLAALVLWGIAVALFVLISKI